MLRSNALHPSSGSKSKSNKELARSYWQARLEPEAGGRKFLGNVGAITVRTILFRR
jgi:hypothetical protein